MNYRSNGKSRVGSVVGGRAAKLQQKKALGANTILENKMVILNWFNMQIKLTFNCCFAFIVSLGNENVGTIDIPNSMFVLRACMHCMQIDRYCMSNDIK